MVCEVGEAALRAPPGLLAPARPAARGGARRGPGRAAAGRPERGRQDLRPRPPPGLPAPAPVARPPAPRLEDVLALLTSDAATVPDQEQACQTLYGMAQHSSTDRDSIISVGGIE